MRLVWKEDGNLLARKMLDFIPDDFHGRLLDVPVGTAIFTARKYRQMKAAEIIGLDYSKEMIAIATLRKETENITNLSLYKVMLESCLMQTRASIVYCR